jgi:stearoyl-CoA desaturase (Delta-9 desaturase)
MLSWLWIPLVALVVTQAAVVATSIYLHRALAHRSLTLHPAMDIFFRTILWLTTVQRRQEWVAVHRKHHTFTDRPGDPHSPQVVGFWRVQIFNVYYYLREARNHQTVETFAPDLVEDRWDSMIFSWGWSGLGLGTSVLCLLFGFWSGILAMTIHGVLYAFVLAPLVNGLGHWRGTQNFANTAYNSRVLACVTGGESLHNNHHAYPRAARFSVGRHEFDPSWILIRLLNALGFLAIKGEQAELRQTS